MQMFSSKAQSFSHFLCHLRITVKCTFWFSRSEVSPGILYFSQSPCNIEVAVPFPPLELKSGVRINIWELWSPIWSWVIGSFPKAMNFVMLAQNCPVIQTLPLSPPPPAPLEFPGSYHTRQLYHLLPLPLLSILCSCSQLKGIWDSRPSVHLQLENISGATSLLQALCQALEGNHKQKKLLPKPIWNWNPEVRNIIGRNSLPHECLRWPEMIRDHFLRGISQLISRS